jgi:hypothetical protein
MFRAGALVEVRSKEEILATLGPDGRLDGLPFMPEMLPLCGRRFRVSRVAHKTCDTTTFSGGRRMADAVFLEDLRCDGSAHGGCQARCLLFWKTRWLKPVDAGRSHEPAPTAAGCSEQQLQDATHAFLEAGDERYFCQATEHLAATQPLRPLAISHFLADIRAGNARPAEVLTILGLHLVWQLRFAGILWRFSVWLYARLHRLVTGRPDPFREGRIPKGLPTPDDRLDLQPGDLVEVKSHDEILETLGPRLRNRGLGYNPEMTPVCGQTLRVAQRVTRIIEEKSGRMLIMKNPCITLEGVYCQALYTHYSLLCSRRVTPYFREVWLRRAGGDPSAQGEGPRAGRE